MRVFIILLSLLLGLSCTGLNKKPELQLDKFIYSAYNWYLNDSMNGYKFYLAQYLSMDKNGNCRIMRQVKGSAYYFKTVINDTNVKRLNSLFADKTYKKNYANNPDSPIIYNGFKYVIQYESPSAEQRIFQFIPSFAPPEIRILQEQLDSLIFNTTNDTVNEFNLTAFIDSLIEFSQKINPPPPPLKPVIRFKQ